MSIEVLIISFSYLGIFLLMIINGLSGFPSSQLVYIISGYFAFRGDLNMLPIILTGGIGNLIGNYILYEVSRKKGLKYILSFKVFKKRDILKVNTVMKEKGWWFLFFGKFINPVKIVIPIPCGLAKVNRLIYVLIIYITSTLWALAFILLGYYFGKSFTFAFYYVATMIVLTIAFIGIFYKYMNNNKQLNLVEE